MRSSVESEIGVHHEEFPALVADVTGVVSGFGTAVTRPVPR